MAESSKEHARKKRLARRAKRSAILSGYESVTSGRKLPYFNVLNDAELEQVFQSVDCVLSEIGFEFPEDNQVLTLWEDAGAIVRDCSVYFPKGLCQKILSSAPQSFVHHARNSENSIEVGGQNVHWGPAQGAIYVRSENGKRQQATLQDLKTFTKLCQSSSILSTIGAGFCEPTEVPPNLRHLDMMYAMLALSDKPFFAPAYSSDSLEDIFKMSGLVFGEDFVKTNCVFGSVVNLSSALNIDLNALECLKFLSENGQATVISPLVLLGSTSPITAFDALVQMLACNLALSATTQLINPGAPVILGGFISSVYMQNGAPNFASSDAEMIMFAASQCVRHLGLPFRSAGGQTMSKVPDVQAMSETSAGLNACMTSGAHMNLSAIGSLEGGLVGCFEKFLLDVHQLYSIHSHISGLHIPEKVETVDVLKQTDSYGYFMGSRHTLNNYDSHSYRNPLFNDWTYEQWKAADAKSVNVQAKHMAKRLLDDYQQPTLDKDVENKLTQFIAQRKAEIEPGDVAHSSRFLEVDVQSFLANQLHDGIWDGLFQKPSQ